MGAGCLGLRGILGWWGGPHLPPSPLPKGLALSLMKQETEVAALGKLCKMWGSSGAAWGPGDTVGLVRRAPGLFEPGYCQGWGNTTGTWKISCPGRWCLNTSARAGWDVSLEGLVGSTEESGVEQGEQRSCLSPWEPQGHLEQGSKRLRS